MEADSSSDDEDSVPLSQLLGSPNTKTRTPTIPFPAKTLKNFKKNDIDWAKLPPPIAAITSKSVASASLSGCSETHLLESSEICGFEENRAQTAKGVGAEHSDGIGIALQELSRRAAVGTMCSCRRRPDGEEVGEFEPKEMVGFVKDVALCAWVGADDAAGAARLSAQVNGYRHYVSVCRTSGVDGGFRAENLLGFLKSLCVSWGSDEWEDECLGGEAGQIDAYRRFVCVRPDWVLPQGVEVEDGSVSDEYEGSELDISDPSLVVDKASGVTCEWEDDGFSTAISKDDSEIYQEQMQGGRVICVINRADFSILDLDEEYEPMMSNPLEPVVTSDNNCSNENLEMDDMCSNSSSHESDIEVDMACTSSFLHVTDTNQTETMNDLQRDGLSQESEIGVVMACTRSFSNVTDTYQTEADGTKFLVDESLNSSNCCNADHMIESTVGLSGDLSHSALHGVLDITLENNKSKEESTNPVIEDVIPIPSEDHHLRESTPCSEEKFPTTPSSKWQAHPCDEIDEFQSCAKNSIVNSHHGSQSGGLVDVMSSSHQAEALGEPLVKKRRLEQSICDVEHDIIFAVSISSANNGFSETAPCVGQLMRGLDGESQAISLDTTLKFDVDFESSTEDAAASNDRDQSETLKTNSCSFSQIKAAEGNVAKKIRRDQFIASSKSNLQNVISPSSGKIQYSARMMRHINSARDEVLSHIEHIVASKASDKVVCKPHPTGKDNVSSRIECPHSSDSSKPACKSTSHQNKKHNQHMVPDWRRYYASPLVSCATKSPCKAGKRSEDDKFGSFPKSLHMKFPRDFDIPSKEKLAKTFEMFGQVDFLRTKVSPYTGAAQVFFLRQASAYAAHEYVKKRNVFGQVNVRFWVDQHENYRKGAQVKPTLKYSSPNLKSCLKRPGGDKEKRKVRFTLENKHVSVS